MLEFAAALYAIEKLAEWTVFFAFASLIGVAGLSFLVDKLRAKRS